MFAVLHGSGGGAQPRRNSGGKEEGGRGGWTVSARDRKGRNPRIARARLLRVSSKAEDQSWDSSQDTLSFLA